MADPIPPIPYKAQITNDAGYLSDPWSKWFRVLYSRIGGTSAPDNNTITVLQNAITILQSSLASLQTTVSVNSTSINNLNNEITDLNQGPVL